MAALEQDLLGRELSSHRSIRYRVARQKFHPPQNPESTSHLRGDLQTFCNLEFRLAENRLQHLENEMEPVIAAHHEANACCECERYIQVSIVVFNSISQAEKTKLEADREGVQEFTDEQHDAIKLVYERWQEGARSVAMSRFTQEEADENASTRRDLSP